VADEGKRRIAMNEATFRRINEAVRGDPPDAVVAFLCECGRLGCNQLIGLTRAQYEAVRSHPRRFALVPGHEIIEAEDVVERHAEYRVVEKHADASDVVERTDPRRGLDV
jgi:predicted ThiF/HesA family dinucleotide-utilizing enzyme